jgi:protein-S-isoprenylcysteine O-methyltransferase Ste14
MQKQPQAVKVQLWLRALIAPLAIVALLLISAGRFDYWQGWVYTALNMGLLLLTLVVLRNSPELIQERLKPGEGMKRWDKVYFALSTPLYFVMLVVAGLDAGRFGWTGELPWPVYTASAAVYVLGHALFLWAKAANRYFSSVVRIQLDRGHTVCREGPYRYVRHPGYVGGILFGVTAPLMLGSLWAAIPQVIAALMLVARTAREDATLRAELPGYAAYAEEVRYRLLPGVW